MTAYLDTHVAAWLYAGRLDLFPQPVLDRLDEDDLAVSPMVALELEYLFERGKVREDSPPVLDALRRDLGVRLCDLGFDRVAEVACQLRFTRDPFDRLIAAHARAGGGELVTKDLKLRQHCNWTVWSD